LTSHKKEGGVLLLDTTDDKTGETILDILWYKHPDARVPDVSEFEMSATLLDFVDLDIMEDVVEKVAR
jgi:hypothetical protein